MIKQNTNLYTSIPVRWDMHLRGAFVANGSLTEVALDWPAKKNVEPTLPTGEAHPAAGHILIKLWSDE